MSTFESITYWALCIYLCIYICIYIHQVNTATHSWKSLLTGSMPRSLWMHPSQVIHTVLLDQYEALKQTLIATWISLSIHISFLFYRPDASNGQSIAFYSKANYKSSTLWRCRYILYHLAIYLQLKISIYWKLEFYISLRDVFLP